jgi:hypothetical protein
MKPFQAIDQTAVSVSRTSTEADLTLVALFRASASRI